MLIANNVSFSYRNKRANITNAIFESANFSLPDTGFVSFKGKSGAGKTTLLSIIGGLVKPTEGSIVVDGIDISKLSNISLDKYRNELVGFVFQDFNLFSNETVLNNLFFGSSRKKDDIVFASECLKKVGLDGFEQRKVNTLSIGQMQRVAIAYCLYKDSKIILCDEPTGSLDKENSVNIMVLLKELSKEKLVCVVSHNDDLIEKYSDIIYEIDNKSVNLLKGQEEESKNDGAKYSISKLNSLYFGLKKFFQLVFKSLLKTKLLAIFSSLILVGQIAVISSIYSINTYSKESVYIQTFEASNKSIIPLATSIDNLDKSPWGYLKERENIYWDSNVYKSSISDVEEASNSIDNLLSVAPVYTFQYGFQSFLDQGKMIDINLIDSFHFLAFNYFVGLNDFSSFNVPLIKGSLPIKENEVLIYDYMEECLNHFGVIEGDVLNKVLNNRNKGFSFKVVGVIKSTFKDTLSFLEELLKKDYYYSEYGGMQADMIMSYTLLGQLMNIIGFKSFVDSNIEYATKNSYSIDFIEYSNFSGEDSIITSGFDYSLISKSNINNINLEYQNKENDYGYILSKKKIMEISGINEENIFDNTNFFTKNNIPKEEWIPEDFYHNKGIQSFVDYYSMTASSLDTFDLTYRSTIDFSDYLSIYGVLPIEEDNSYLVVDENEIANLDSSPFSKVQMKYFYPAIILGNNKNLNKKVIKKLMPTFEQKANSFYEKQQENYFVKRYVIYDLITSIIDSSYRYIEKVNKTSIKILVVLALVGSAFMIMFSVISIKFNFYEISVLKSRGCSNIKLVSIFGLGALCILILSSIISIPFSVLLVNSINNVFTGSLVGGVTFYSYSLVGSIVSIGISLGILAISTFVPLFLLFKKSPLLMIKKNK